MKAALVTSLGVLLLVGLVVLPSLAHAPVALALFGVARLVDREVMRGIGKPGRWLIAMAFLVAVGAWLGPRDATLCGFRVSAVGSLAGITMAARAAGLLLVTSAITRSVVPDALLDRLGRTRARPLAASVVVALRLAPELATMVRARAAEAKVRIPGFHRAPLRWFDVLVVAVAHASKVADEIATDQPADGGAARKGLR